MARKFFNVEMLPAKHGDALFVEYGSSRTRRMLIDGGPLGAWNEVEKRLSAIPAGDQSVELLVVTHVDTDHIEGIIRLLAMPEQDWPIHVEEVWFNGWRHIEEADTLGGREGEFMSALIHHRLGDRWNTSFDGNAVLCAEAGDEEIEMEGGMKLTIVSPDAEALAALRKDWAAKLKTATWEMDPGDLEAAWEKLVDTNKFHPDSELTLGPDDLTDELLKLLKGVDPSKANGSSIAFIARYGTKSCLFLGDAHMKVICASLRRLGYTEDEPLKVSAVKVSHHGSRNNLTQDLLRLVDAKHWLFSSNGDQHEHPDPEAVEAVIQGSTRKPTLWFNYRSPFTEKWAAGAKKQGAGYAVRYPAAGREGIIVRL